MDFCLAIEIRVKKLPEHTDHTMSQRFNRSYTIKKTFKKFMTIIIIIGLFSSVLRYSFLWLILCCKFHVDNWLIKRMQCTTYLPAS